ncbi:phosphopentomutase [Diplocloster modestus]|uniref:Phosphopentomutase n=1 Tax=Diplocloster modestus TaxID=2850322 RepID=A0ABS6K9M0_9FIRM|nr:phosphopentomutase [Diplocloster modestus]MBU9727210.1 phosphopentomutase [Diplocloster modestus]
MKVICLIVDALGIGQMEDVPLMSRQCEPANTLLHVSRYGHRLHIPVMQKLGLGNIARADGLEAAGVKALASCGKMELGYEGADTYLGHQIIMGSGSLNYKKITVQSLCNDIIEYLIQNGHTAVLYQASPGPVLVDGCVMIADCMEAAPGLSLNVTASLQDVSLDYVMEIASLVRDIVPVTRVIVVCSEIFSFTQIESAMVTRENGASGVDTPHLCLLDEKITLRHLGLKLDLNGQCPTRVARTKTPVYLIGKAADVVQCPQARVISLVDTEKIFQTVEQIITTTDDYLVIANIQETDLAGHSQDFKRWADLLEQVDRHIPTLLEAVGDDGAFILTGDHGNDPYVGKGQHTREYTPCLLYSSKYIPNHLGIRKTLADIGATIADLFDAGPTQGGISLLRELQKKG